MGYRNQPTSPDWWPQLSVAGGSLVPIALSAAGGNAGRVGHRVGNNASGRDIAAWSWLKNMEVGSLDDENPKYFWKKHMFQTTNQDLNDDEWDSMGFDGP